MVRGSRRARKPIVRELYASGRKASSEASFSRSASRLTRLGIVANWMLYGTLFAPACRRQARRKAAGPRKIARAIRILPAIEKIGKREMDPKFIRNFCIIAHIDHWQIHARRPLAGNDRALTSREMHEQVLDSHGPGARARITIKQKVFDCTTKRKMEYLPAEFNRYAGPCGLFLRSFARACPLAKARCSLSTLRRGVEAQNRREYFSRRGAQPHDYSGD